MLVAIGFSEPPAVQDAAWSGAQRGSSQEPDAPSPVAASAPAFAPPPEDSQDVKVQWDNENGVVVQITNKKSGELVRQIPSEQVLSVAHFIAQLLEEEGIPPATAAGTSSAKNGN